MVPRLHNLLVFPDAARVVLRACNDSVTLVVKGARKDFVFVTVQRLQLVTCVARPNLARLVTARRDDLVALWVELNLRNFVFVAL